MRPPAPIIMFLLVAFAVAAIAQPAIPEIFPSKKLGRPKISLNRPTVGEATAPQRRIEVLMKA
jgi:hypothetical protein